MGCERGGNHSPRAGGRYRDVDRVENPTLRRLSVGVSLVQKPDPAKLDRGTGRMRNGDGGVTGKMPVPRE